MGTEAEDRRLGLKLYLVRERGRSNQFMEVLQTLPTPLQEDPPYVVGRILKKLVKTAGVVHSRLIGADLARTTMDELREEQLLRMAETADRIEAACQRAEQLIDQLNKVAETPEG
jgi:hypothetical protein